MTSTNDQLDGLGNYEYGWADPDSAGASARRGLNEDVVRDISAKKNEPEWMLEQRLKGLRLFDKQPMPSWGADLSGIDFDNIKYFVRSTEKQATSWEELPEDIKNTYDRLGIPEAEKQRLIAGVAAQYECLAGDSRVWTVDRGFVPIKEICPGDRVFAFDEESAQFLCAPVRATAQTGVRQTYRITVGTRQIRATDNHPLLVLADSSDPLGSRQVWKTVGDLRPGDLVAVPRSLPDAGTSRDFPAGFGPRRSTSDLLWLLGLLVGAGTVATSGGTPHVEIGVAGSDRELRAEIARVLAEQFGLSTTGTGTDRIAVTSPELGDWLLDAGIGGPSSAPRIPTWIHSLPVAQRLSFLGGYIDAAGHIGPDASNAVHLTSGNESLLEDAAALAWLSGLRASRLSEFASLDPADPDRLVPEYRITVAGALDQLDCRNPRRTQRFGPRTPHTPATEQVEFRRVTGIEPHEVEPVYDIEVDGPHNFVAEGMVVHNSEVVYHKIREDLEEQGVLFLDTDTALKEHEDLFREYFGTVIPSGDNKFSALNTAVWSGGSFIYVPKNVHVEIPLQAYFRINTENMGQFERTLIVVDEGSYVHYVEGCTAPIYSSDSLHSAVVEIIVKDNARCRYTTIQNWSTNVYNLVTKRAQARRGATMEWVDGNLGSKVTMKYPAVWLMGEHAKGETLSVAFAGPNQHQDAGAKMVHAAPNTSSSVISKSVARGGGRSSYRGLVQVMPNASGSASTVRCDALLVDDESRSDTYPYNDIRNDDVSMGHEATVSKVSEDQLFYLQSRGIPEDEAMAMIVRGFIEPIARELPMEYALELNRLIELQMEGAVG